MTVPTRSNRPVAPSARPPRSTAAPRHSTTAPSGTLRKKTQLQSAFSTISPPTTGPAAVEAAMTALRTAIGMLSRSAGNALRSRPRVAGCISAPNAPWKTRRPTTQPSCVDRPIATDVAVKPTTPMRKILRWPNRSPILPAVMSSAATASRYPLVTHWMPVRSVPRSDCMAGWATVTIIPSSDTIIAPTESVVRVSQGWPRIPARPRRDGCCPSRRRPVVGIVM